MRRELLLKLAVLARVGFSAPTTGSYIVRDDPQDPDDLSFIKKISGIGDSYSAGIGAGSRLGKPSDPWTFGDWKCSRYDKSYPALFHSCSGAVMQEIIDEQVWRLDDNQDVILLSGGGNDAELLWILNHCVFRFFSPTEATANALEATAAAAEAPPALLLWFEENKEKFTRSCDKQLEISEEIINSDDYTKRIGDLIDKSKKKLKDSGTIYYTGYAKFWDTDIADDDYCSKKENSWSFFYNIDDPTKIISDKAFLTKERRAKMNSLETIKAKAEKGSKGLDRVVFIDYDEYFGDVKGRFCTKGVEKSEKDRKDDLTFYPLNLWDPLGSNDFKRDDPVEVFNGTFEGDINNLALLADYSGAHYRSDVPMIKAKAKAAEAEANDVQATEKADGDDKKPDKRMSILPDGYGRVFHPTIAGHGIMAKLVLWNIAKRNAQALGSDYADQVVMIGQNDTCSLESQEPSDVPELGAKCTGDDRVESALKTNVFYERGKGVFDEFCKQMDENQLDDRTAHNWTVNAKGEHQEGASKKKRTPPPNPQDFKQMINFSWTPNKDSADCKASCQDAYSSIAQSPCGTRGGRQNIMSIKAQYNGGCGEYSYEITGEGVPKQPDPAVCLNGVVPAPKNDGDVEENIGTSIKSAFTKWCKDNDGKTVEAKPATDTIYQRYGISHWGVGDRTSFWVRATFIDGCAGKIEIKKDECIQNFNDGLNFCDQNSGLSHGYVATSECLEYAVETSFRTNDNSPPWNPEDPNFPPTENVKNSDDRFSSPSCDKNLNQWSPIKPHAKIDDAIDKFCNDGKDLQPVFDYGSPEAFHYANGDTHIYLAGENINNNKGPGESSWRPAKDMRWCDNGFDWKKHPDDCKYGLRKLTGTCNPNKYSDNAAFMRGSFVYRCVIWRVI